MGWVATRLELRFAAHRNKPLGGCSGGAGVLRSQISQSPENGDEEGAEWRRARALGAARSVEHEPLKYLGLTLWEAESGQRLRCVLARQSRQRDPVVEAR